MSSKSSYIIGVIRRYESIGVKVFAINHSNDVRFGKDSINTHDGASIPCVMTNQLQPLLQTQAFKEADVIIIEEVQFFDAEDLTTFCETATNDGHKKVTAAGLNGDRNRKPWPGVSALIPLAESIVHLTGFCTRCADGSPGCYTCRKPEFRSDPNLIGTSKQYMLLCRKHYLELEDQSQKVHKDIERV